MTDWGINYFSPCNIAHGRLAILQTIHPHASPSFQIQAGHSQKAVGEVYIFKTGKANKSCDTDWDLK
jgi:hypothetical protein